MQIRKIAGIDPADPATVERAFGAVEAQPIDSCNWPTEFPYAPQASFRMFHTGTYLMLRFDVAERYTTALVTEDNGEVWTDSCVEFFIAPDSNGYYNFEATSIGRLLLAHRTAREENVVHATPEVLAKVVRTTTLPCEPFAEREGDNRWSLTLAIPPEALFRHEMRCWDGVVARMNLYKCGDKLSHPHFLSWQPVGTEKPDFHRPEYFADALFADR